MFVAPPEVHREIVDHSKRIKDHTAYDVLSWCLEQSCNAIEQAQPLRILQGLNHGQRRAAMRAFEDKFEDFEEFGALFDNSSDLVKRFREQENQQVSCHLLTSIFLQGIRDK